MHIYFSKDAKTYQEKLKEDNIKVGYQYLSAHVGGQWMRSFPCNAFVEECKDHLKMFKMGQP